MRQLSELVDVASPAWPALSDALLDAAPRARILPVTREDGERCLYRLQVTAGSTLGALSLHTGGVVIDAGWIRLLGGGCDGLPDLASANGLGDPSSSTSPPPYLLVAFDVLGGQFAVNGGGLGGTPGEVSYWGPDTLEWQPVGLGHTDFVHWSLGDGLASFYADLRWSGWEEEVANVPLGAGLSVYPPLCTAESRPIADTSRRPVPWRELSDVLKELSGLPEGRVRFSSGPSPP